MECEEPRKGIIICPTFEDRGFRAVILPHGMRMVAVFAGILLGMIPVFIVSLILRDTIIDFLLLIISIFPPPYEIFGFLIGLVLFLLIILTLQLFITWLVTRWLVNRYITSWSIYRTPIQHRLARLIKYFSQGCFLALFIALASSPFIDLYIAGDWTTGLFIIAALAIIFIYGGSTIGYLLTDIFFYYYYTTQGGQK